MNIEAMSDKHIENLYRNCINTIIGNKSNKLEAKTYIGEINTVWQARLSAAIAYKYKAESPEYGVLRTMGYAVGNDGLTAKRRRVLLDYAMTGTLPFVGSPAHMYEWGEPNSRTRYQKLHRVLASWRTSASREENKTKAHNDWDQDIKYIERTWKPR